MRTTTRAAVQMFSLLTLMSVVGCGQSGPAITPVQGWIKINGKNAANLMIQFNPVSWPEGTPVVGATAVSDESGNFVLKAHDGRDGAPIGKHKVTVIDNNLNVADEPRAGAKRIVNRVPFRYASTTSTPLEITVEAGKSNYELELAPR